MPRHTVRSTWPVCACIPVCKSSRPRRGTLRRSHKPRQISCKLQDGINIIKWKAERKKQHTQGQPTDGIIVYYQELFHVVIAASRFEHGTVTFSFNKKKMNVTLNIFSSVDCRMCLTRIFVRDIVQMEIQVFSKAKERENEKKALKAKTQYTLSLRSGVNLEETMSSPCLIHGLVFYRWWQGYLDWAGDSSSTASGMDGIRCMHWGFFRY